MVHVGTGIIEVLGAPANTPPREGEARQLTLTLNLTLTLALTLQARLCGLEAALERERTRAQWTTAAAGVAAAAALVACVIVVRY